MASLDGGRLQMLRVVGVAERAPRSHAGERRHVRRRLGRHRRSQPTFPYTPGEPAPTANNDAINYVGNQGRAQGAAHFSRLEGAAFTDGKIFFTSTQGGGAAEAGPDTDRWATATAPARSGRTTRGASA